MSFCVQRIDHVEALVRDIAAAARWYHQALGLDEVQRWHPEPVLIGAGGTCLALFQAWPDAASADDDRRYNRIRWQRVAWRVDRAGLEAAQRHLKSRGIWFRGPVDHGTTASIYFHDPDGNPLEITCESTKAA